MADSLPDCSYPQNLVVLYTQSYPVIHWVTFYLKCPSCSHKIWSHFNQCPALCPLWDLHCGFALMRRTCPSGLVRNSNSCFVSKSSEKSNFSMNIMSKNVNKSCLPLEMISWNKLWLHCSSVVHSCLQEHFVPPLWGGCSPIGNSSFFQYIWHVQLLVLIMVIMSYYCSLCC